MEQIHQFINWLDIFSWQTVHYIIVGGIAVVSTSLFNSSRELTNLKKKLTSHALEIAETYGIKLDYSDESIKQVEKILGEIHKGYKKIKPNDRKELEEELDGIAQAFGAYIISVIERNYEAGKWKKDHPEMGKNTFPYYWKGLTFFPNAWCYKRIVTGKADDVWAKYYIIVINHLKETK
ncbi:MAG TPA: hypothetical protein VK338_06520 [Candidatus Nitrosocosmicus sp.]|nr:hypothetical protein [Candidatus Nitrosocosmicus sp.]